MASETYQGVGFLSSFSAFFCKEFSKILGGAGKLCCLMRLG
jgi:hypothetical protein